MRGWGTDGNLYALHKHEQELDREAAREAAIEQALENLDEDDQDKAMGDALDTITTAEIEACETDAEVGELIMTAYRKEKWKMAEKIIDNNI